MNSNVIEPDASGRAEPAFASHTHADDPPSREKDVLRRVRAYENDDVVDAFTQAFDIPAAEARVIFEDMKSWLWLNFVAASKPEEARLRLAVDSPIMIIDEMWHTFILFTGAYTRFCNTHFGRYLHHEPTTKAARQAYAAQFADRAALREHAISEKRAQYHFVYDELGHDVFMRWYHEYPDIYSQKTILGLRKK